MLINRKYQIRFTFPIRIWSVIRLKAQYFPHLLLKNSLLTVLYALVSSCLGKYRQVFILTILVGLLFPLPPVQADGWSPEESKTFLDHLTRPSPLPPVFWEISSAQSLSVLRKFRTEKWSRAQVTITRHANPEEARRAAENFRIQAHHKIRELSLGSFSYVNYRVKTGQALAMVAEDRWALQFRIDSNKGEFGHDKKTEGEWLQIATRMITELHRRLLELISKLKFSITVELEDTDGQLTAADEAEIVLTVRNSQRKSMKRLKLSGRIAGQLMQNRVIRLHGGEGTDPHLFVVQREILKPGDEWRLRKAIRTAGERNAWVYSHLIQGVQEDAKPEPELGVSLEGLLELKLVELEEGEREQILFEETVSVMEKGSERPARISYPDLIDAAYLWGHPDVGDVEEAYHRNGDPGWSVPGNEIVRAVALRAARFGPDPDVNMPLPGSAPNQLLAPGEGDWDSPRMPDEELDRIVKNLAHFVHQSLMPKKPSGNVTNAMSVARGFWNGKYGPDRKAGKHFICQQHSTFLGGLLRALGLPTREVNVHHWPFWPVAKFWSGELWNNEGWKAKIFSAVRQDAGNQVYYDDKWHEYQLFHNEKVHTEADHHRLYTFDRWYWVYDMWVGVAPWAETMRGRFNTTWGTQFSSPEWRYYGYGDKDGFTKMNRPAWSAGEGVPFFQYKWFSPLAAMVVLPDNRRVGTDLAVDVTVLEPLYLDPQKWPDHIINEVPDAAYLPEGIRLFSNAADAASGPPLPQIILVPADSSEAYKKHRFIMIGIGNGRYSLEATFVSKDGVTVVGSHEGEIRRGQTIELYGDQLVAIPPTPMADLPWDQLEILVSSASRHIQVSANQERFRIGEPLVVTVEVDRDGYLNVLNLGPGDTVPTVLYPNQLHPNNRVSSGQRVRIPGAEDWFELPAQGPAGKNLIVVVHTVEPINAYRDGAGSPGDLFKTLPASRGFAVKAKKDRSGMSSGKLELVVE